MEFYLVVRIISDLKSYGKGGEIYAVTGEICNLVSCSLDGMALLQKKNGVKIYTKSKNIVFYEPSKTVRSGIFGKTEAKKESRTINATPIIGNSGKTGIDKTGGRSNIGKPNFPTPNQKNAQTEKQNNVQFSLF